MHDIDVIVFIIIAIVGAIRSATKAPKAPPGSSGDRLPQAPIQNSLPEAPLGGAPQRMRPQASFTSGPRPSAKPLLAAASATTMRPLEQRTIQSTTVPETDVQRTFQAARETSEQEFLEEREQRISAGTIASARGQQRSVRPSALVSEAFSEGIVLTESTQRAMQPLLNAIILAQVFSAPKCKLNAVKRRPSIYK